MFNNIYELLPGIKNFRIGFEYKNYIILAKNTMFRDDWRVRQEFSEEFDLEKSPEYDQRLIIIDLIPTLIVQYTKMLIKPITMPKYQSLSFNMFKRCLLATRTDNKQDNSIEIKSIRLARVPKYLMFFCVPQANNILTENPQDVTTSYTKKQ